jgi:MarR family transcriptional regulator, lower aerobic nicotinate degradation pathway regulator
MPIRSTRKKPEKAGAPKGRVASEDDVSLENVIYNKPGFLVRRMQQVGVSIFLEETKSWDITPLQYGVMSAVRATPGVDQIGVANSVGLDRTTVVGIVDRLERKGLIVRRADAEDRRVRQLFLTAAGQQRLSDVRSATDRAQVRLLEPLNEKERTIFLGYIKRVVAHHNEDSRVPVHDAALRATITGSRADGQARAT